MRDIDKYRGCMIGGAAGDALGYAVEFQSENEIFSRYGKNGICEYELDSEEVARFSDDTQMMLYTANGLLLGTTRGNTRGVFGTYPGYVRLFYEEWYRTQTESYPLEDQKAWISALPELYAHRAPGSTCLSACAAGAKGSPDSPINNSKGCGGIMRVAPVGLYFNPEDGQICEYRKYTYTAVQRFGAETAALTHGHELGWLPAGAFAHIVSFLAHEGTASIKEAVESAIWMIPEAYPRAKHARELQDLLKTSIRLSKSRFPDLDAIHELGEGWVAEETLAIAVLCALRHQDDFEGAVISAVNHSGDSDSTGAVTGNIVGAHIGLSGVPMKYIDHLELAEVITEMADDLFNDCQIDERNSSDEGTWEHKYIETDYLEWKALR